MILNYITQRQALEYWCWAAVASSVSFFYNKNQRGYLQGQIGSNETGASCENISGTNNQTYDPACNVSKDLARALHFTKNFAWDIPRALTFDEVLHQINGYFPFCCQIYWPQLEKSHFVCVYGYQGKSLVVGDPEQQSNHYIDFDDFLNYRQGIWVRTIGTQQTP